MAATDDFSVSNADDLLQLIYTKPSGLIVVIGGQAVNFWADRYLAEDARLKDLRPFTSRDLDLLGEIANAYRIASQLHVDVQRPRKSSASPVLANVDVPTGRVIRAVQFLRSVCGVTKSEIIDNAVPFDMREIKFYVADPITMLKSKLHNVVELDQRGRNDRKHVDILHVCVPIFLRRLLESAPTGESAVRGILRNMQRVLSLSRTAVAQKVWAETGFDRQELIPLTELGKVSASRLKNFRDEQLRRWIIGR